MHDWDLLSVWVLDRYTPRRTDPTAATRTREAR
jgi:hypothetical protein